MGRRQTAMEIIVPRAGPPAEMLDWIFELCDDVKEGKDSCLLLHKRLETICTHLITAVDGDAAPPSDVVPRFTTTLKTLWTELAPYRGLTFLERLVRHKRLEVTIASANGEVEALFRILGLDTAKKSMDWPTQWELDVKKLNEHMSDRAANERLIMSELRSVKAQSDALVLLRFEIEKMRTGKSDQPAPVQHMIETCLQTIVRNIKDAVVPYVPDWFIADADISYDPVPFARGSFGTVHHGSYNGADVVVKLLFTGEGGFDGHLQHDFVAEANMWGGLLHPHVVRMIGASHIFSRPFIIYEEVENGNLAQYLRKKNSPAVMWKMLQQAALGLYYLHQKRFVHGDLRLSNILIGSDGVARIADFGLQRVKSTARAWAVETDDGEGTSGWIRWFAPERFTHMPQFVSDVYALGICIIESVSGVVPYHSISDTIVRENILKGVLPDRPEGLSDEGWSLVLQMTAMDRSDRISLEDAITKLDQLAKTAEAMIDQELLIASSDGNLEIVEQLLHEGVDPDTKSIEVRCADSYRNEGAT